MKVSLNQSQNIITINPDTPIDWDEFEQWGQNLINKLEQSQFNHKDTGADRHKLTFTFRQNRFSLNYETYSDSIWIETDEPSANNGIEQLQAAIAAIS